MTSTVPGRKRSVLGTLFVLWTQQFHHAKTHKRAAIYYTVPKGDQIRNI